MLFEVWLLVGLLVVHALIQVRVVILKFLVFTLVQLQLEGDALQEKDLVSKSLSNEYISKRIIYSSNINLLTRVF